jgi:hypothetical protein
VDSAEQVARAERAERAERPPPHLT